eukprot:768590-Hanusia_phi.AAC.18
MTKSRWSGVYQRLFTMAPRRVWVMSGAAAAAMMMAMVDADGNLGIVWIKENFPPAEVQAQLLRCRSTRGEVARDNLQRSMDEANKEVDTGKHAENLLADAPTSE